MRDDVAIMMTAWKRQQYFRKTLQSWSEVRGIGDVPITVFLEPSDRREQMLELIRDEQVMGLLSIDVFENPEQLGVLVNPVESAGRMFRENPGLRYLIFAEDDLVVSDDVLDYFLWVDRNFRADPETLLVCAHSAEGSTPQSDPSAVTVGTRFRCWVWATWRDRWEDVIEPTWDRAYSTGEHEGDGAGWDYNLDSRIIPRGGYRTVLPACSRSQNIGKFEGAHASPASFASTLNSSFRSVFGVVDYQLSSISVSTGLQ